MGFTINGIVYLENDNWYCSKHRNHNKASPMTWQIVWNTKTRTRVKTKTICSASLKVRGCSLFNILPKHIRNAENVTTNCFKKQLDKFLKSVLDEPCLPHYYKSAVSNSIIDQMQAMRLNPASYTTTDHYNRPLQNYNKPLKHYSRQQTTATCSGLGLTHYLRNIGKYISKYKCVKVSVLMETKHRGTRNIEGHET